MGAFYVSSIAEFLQRDEDAIIGALTSAGNSAGFYQQIHTQTDAWEIQISLLRQTLTSLNISSSEAKESGILLEYTIARRSKRIDAVLLLGASIFVLEFKIGATRFNRADEEQLLDYCLDLRDFHFESRNKVIYPILIATEARLKGQTFITCSEPIQPITYCNSSSLALSLNDLVHLQHSRSLPISYKRWNESVYAPTPTIIEAAQTLFAGKDVAEISRSHAGLKNLTRTTEAIVSAIEHAKLYNEKIVCFITGVPGAGKTLAGLNIAHYPAFQAGGESLATFVSGNSPLIKVLREALSRDATKRLKKLGQEIKQREQERIIAFIENVHAFFDKYYGEDKPAPNNKIVIFDEAQRAWNADYSKRKFERPLSEPELMLQIMDRHTDWAALVALIGGGQEINNGEGGIQEWIKAISEKYPEWNILTSPQLNGGDHSTGSVSLYKEAAKHVTVIENPDLHLDVSIRSYKAEDLSKWVALVLQNEPEEAYKLFVNKLTEYPIFITRTLNTAMQFLRSKRLGTRRVGLLASSGAKRIRAYGIEMSASLKGTSKQDELGNWYLNATDDIRSSNFLEVPANEYAVQGLELDWTCVAWDADLRIQDHKWRFYAFKGTDWQNVNALEKQKYLINKYRVLLTRAREGMVLWVPEGNGKDKTTLPEFYDSIYNYLRKCGVPALL